MQQTKHKSYLKTNVIAFTFVDEAMISVSKLLDFEILECSNLFSQIPGFPGGLEFAQNPTIVS